MKRRTVAFGIMIASCPIAAQATDYLGHMEQFKFAAVMITSGRSCERFKVRADDKGVERFAKSAINNAIKDGMSVTIANRMFLSELKDESERQAYIVGQLGKQPTESELTSFIDYWGERCTKLVTDPRSSPYFFSTHK